jgi:hypothetical protein
MQKFKISAERGTLSAEILDFCINCRNLQKYAEGVHLSAEGVYISAESLYFCRRAHLLQNLNFL